jgi:hypothetical protein
MTTESWMFWYGLLETFVSENKNCNVPNNYKSSDGYRLGGWVNQQRNRRKSNQLSVQRIARLDALGFIWDVLEAQCEEGFDRLKTYVSENKNCKVPQLYRSSDGFRLGGWNLQQRNYRKKGTLTVERIERLDAIGFIWDPFDALWEKGFDRLKTYVSENRNCNVSQSYRTSDGYKLGSWVNHQRLLRKRGKLSAERITRLDALGFIWDVVEAQWEEGFDRLKTYVGENKHCNIPAKYKCSDGFPLGYWLTTQGQFRKNGKISAERTARLDTLGIVWRVRDALWEKGFSHLKIFLEREGHCRVPHDFKTEDGYPLGRWVGKQRSKKDIMGPDRRQRLEALPGWVWKVEKPRGLGQPSGGAVIALETAAQALAEGAGQKEQPELESGS